VSDLRNVRRLTAYNRRVFERYERALKNWGWKEATRDRGIGHLTLKDTLVHILNVHEAWLVAVAQGRWDVFDQPGRRPQEVRSWIDLRKYRERVWQEVDVYLERLSENDLNRTVKAPWMLGKYALKDVFFQISFEQAHHLGEFIGAYWQADRRPPKMTWIENLPGSSRSA
jgi:uncharacterized damage-inducible protein DinB